MKDLDGSAQGATPTPAASPDKLLPYRNMDLEKHLLLREAFALRAPEIPQDWFAPRIPPEPVRPAYPHKPQQADYDDNYNLIFFIPDAEYEEMLKAHELARSAYETAMEKWREDLEKWGCEVGRLRSAQWPWAWADAVLASRIPLETSASESVSGLPANRPQSQIPNPPPSNGGKT